jgi:hypothetical protein
MKRFSNGRIDDRVCSRLHGPGTIKSKNDIELSVKFDNGLYFPFWLDGRYNMTDYEPILFYINGGNEWSTVRPPSHVKANILPIDTLLIVGCSERRYFSEVDSGRIWCFNDGRTSKTTNSWSDCTAYTHATLAENVVIEGVTYEAGSIVVP